MTDAFNLSRDQVIAILPQTFGRIGRVLNPATSVAFAVVPEEDMREGDVRHTTLGSEVDCWSLTRGAILNELRSAIPGAPIFEGIPETYSGRVKILAATKEPAASPNQVAGWYARWLASVHPSAELRDIVGVIAAEQIATEHAVSGIYRGESKLYRRVVSTLARSLDTASPDVLATVASQQLTEARLRVSVPRSEHIDEAIQHLGGKSNLIDFTESPWTALWFAVRDATGEPGRVWALHQTTAQHLRLRRAKEMDIDDAGRRARAQQSVLVEVPTGEIQRTDLREVCQIPGAVKPDVRQFLSQIGVKEETLLPDLLGHVSSDADGIPWSAFVHLLKEKLEKRQFGEVCAITQNMLPKRDLPLDQRTLLYYNGLALALSGRPKEGLDQLDAAAEVYAASRRPLPTVMRRNRTLLLAASKGGDMSRISGRLDLQVDDTFLHETLSGKYRFTTDEGTDYGLAFEQAISYHVQRPRTATRIAGHGQSVKRKEPLASFGWVLLWVVILVGFFSISRCYW